MEFKCSDWGHQCSFSITLMHVSDVLREVLPHLEEFHNGHPDTVQILQRLHESI